MVFVHSVFTKTGFPKLSISVGSEIFPLNKEFGTQTFYFDLGGSEMGLSCYHLFLSCHPPPFFFASGTDGKVQYPEVLVGIKKK